MMIEVLVMMVMEVLLVVIWLRSVRLNWIQRLVGWLVTNLWLENTNAEIAVEFINYIINIIINI